MRHTRIFALIAAATLCTSAWAQQAIDPQRQPTIKRIEHQRMMIDNRVIYEADVNVLDANATHYWVEFGIDDKTWRLPAADRSVGTAVNEDPVRDGVPGDRWAVSYLVREKDPAGSAQVDLIYTIRDASKGVDKTEHVQADVEEGQRFTTTTPSGAKLWFLVTQQQ
ncbi:hypothetical protein LRM36_02460 [Stenotrophomonas maltophilia]|nr:hypothetical protein [Stenotrophomonas maltophilia]